jgi:hypothetical protein
MPPLKEIRYFMPIFGQVNEELVPFVDCRKIAWPPRNRNGAARLELNALNRGDAGMASQRAGGTIGAAPIGLS